MLFRRGGMLMLVASPNLISTEVTSGLSPNDGVARVNTANPFASVILVVPSMVGDAGVHPVAALGGVNDDASLKLLSWITDGAQDDRRAGTFIGARVRDR